MGENLTKMNYLNKKGEGISFALNNLSEIFLAIAGIFLIIAIIFSTYSCSNNRDQQAKGTLDRINQIITSLDEGTEESLELLAPTGWKIISFNAENNLNAEYSKPNNYFNDNLICVCEKTCKYCRSVNYKVLNSGEQVNLKIEPKIIYFKLENNQISVRIEQLKKSVEEELS